MEQVFNPGDNYYSNCQNYFPFDNQGDSRYCQRLTRCETSAKLRPLADLMNPASLTLQRHMSGSNLSPRNIGNNIGNIPAG